MNLFLLNVILLLGLSMASIPDVMVLGSASRLLMEPEIPIKKCRSSRAWSMLQTICSNLDLEQIPTTLKPAIQILDVSRNRVRNLDNNSFAMYTNLAYLYMADNFLINIEEGTFDKLYYLEVLDLSTNGLTTLPKSLFKLPRLRKLYLEKNQLTDKVFEVRVTSPLIFLQVSKNKLNKIPQIGPLPDLHQLNISYNEISKVSVDDVAPFCSLAKLNLTGNPITNDKSSCEWHTFVQWLRIHNVDALLPFNTTNSNCNVAFSNETLALRDNCTQIMRIRVEAEKARSTWILVASCIGVFGLCLFIALCCVHKRNKKKRQKLKEEQRLAANNANTELLNSNLQQDRT